MELDVSDIEESCDSATVHGVVVELSPVKASGKDSAKKYFTEKLSDGKKTVKLVSFDPSSHAVFDKSRANSSAVRVEKGSGCCGRLLNERARAIFPFLAFRNTKLFVQS